MCLTKHRDMKTYCGNGRIPPRINFGAPRTYMTGGWVGLTASLDKMAKINISEPLPGIEPISSRVA
jgi:hypothetical protein